jgi:hypothetical protein
MPKHREPISQELTEIFPAISSRMSRDNYLEVYEHQQKFLDECRERIGVAPGELKVGVAFWSVDKNDSGIVFDDGVERGGFLMRTICYAPGQNSLQAAPENSQDLFFVTDESDKIVETMIVHNIKQFQ